MMQQHHNVATVQDLSPFALLGIGGFAPNSDIWNMPAGKCPLGHTRCQTFELQPKNGAR